MALKAACIQLTAGPDISANLKDIAPRVRDAVAKGAQLVTLPENVCLMTTDKAKKKASAVTEDKHEAPAFFSQLAAETKCWLMAGSVAIDPGNGSTVNRSFLFGPDGKKAVSYDKIHLFDVDVGGEKYRESETIAPGDKAVLAKTPIGAIGMTICYDVRFGALYRTLAHAGAEIIVVPSAFTVPTGKAHWHTLLKARAIETGCFVLAPAQCGTHDGGRKTYGHSLIISPWGDILAEAGEEPGTIMADLDLAQVQSVRAHLPSLQHDRAFKLV